MKKNRMMRVAVLMLALVLMTSCFVGGTFAKYTTGDNGSEHARVAKWGVQVEIQNDHKLFSNEYIGTGDALTVKSIDSEQVVAPGTSGKTTFSISGTPEVATKISVTVEDIQEVHLGEYYPVKWTLILKSDNSEQLTEPKTLIKDKTLNEVNDYLTTYVSAAEYAPNTDLGAVFELSWYWDINGDNDKDTVLGNAAAGIIPTEVYNLTTGYTISIVIEQVD